MGPMSDLGPSIPWRRTEPELQWLHYKCTFPSGCTKRKYTVLQPRCPDHGQLMTLVTDKPAGGHRG